MATVVDPSIAPRRFSMRRPIVILTFAAVLAAGALFVLGQSDGDRFSAASAIAVESGEGPDLMELLDLSLVPAPNHVPSVSASGCNATGISGDLVGDASPHDVLEAYLRHCRAN
jgi:hypothetical protein